MKRTTAKRGVDALQVLWVVLVVIFGVLIVTNQISGFASSLYAVVVLGVVLAARALRRRRRRS
ncbi:hypothetical protein SAMN05660473_00719 [Arthrobacter sp. 49Tsu3.1M3]|nr:hypothetical protein SAMN05660473_00719 [Arthrobacter sp. 49Tsu3.1M3]